MRTDPGPCLGPVCDHVSLQIQLPRLGTGIYVRIEEDGTKRVAEWDRPEDADAAMRAAGIEP